MSKILFFSHENDTVAMQEAKILRNRGYEVTLVTEKDETDRSWISNELIPFPYHLIICYQDADHLTYLNELYERNALDEVAIFSREYTPARNPGVIAAIVTTMLETQLQI